MINEFIDMNKNEELLSVENLTKHGSKVSLLEIYLELKKKKSRNFTYKCCHIHKNKNME